MDKPLITTECPFEAGDKAEARAALEDYLISVMGKDPKYASERDWFYALTFYVRGRLAQRWFHTMRKFYDEGAKVVYYLSMEFLIGRSLKNNLLNLGILNTAEGVLSDIGVDNEAVYACEFDAALGNGGLGRLAACLLDSITAQAYPGYGYGIRYDYGMFTQRIEDGWQTERPENWLRFGNPWEFFRPTVNYPIRFGGHIIQDNDDKGRPRARWVDTDEVLALAYDTQVAGYDSEVVNKLRLWSAKSTREFNLHYFNEGNYFEAVKDRTETETISQVLYPNDLTMMGKELRLRQEYFFVSASLQDIVNRFLTSHESFDEMPDKVAIQLNDTHPALAVAELMRLMIDEHGVEWGKAWDITRRVFAYANHTLMSEALETWAVPLFESLLPRHLQIIYRINGEWLEYVRQKFPDDDGLVQRVSLIDEAGERYVRMAYLAIVGSQKVNGVSALHADLMCQTTFVDFAKIFPEKMLGITNGITPRRWLKQSNPGLSKLITDKVGKGWEKNLDKLVGLEKVAGEAKFQKAFRAVKKENKERLAGLINDRLGITVDPDSMFDIQVKRMHEYKRQLLNILQVVARYNRIMDGNAKGLTPRTVIFGGKAAPGYLTAKLHIKLINDVANRINNEPKCAKLLKVAFIPNYDVTTAEVIMPAADLSEQISTAGTEASGTGNMKLSLSGALTIGTRDGANIEIAEAVGEENIFYCGLTAEEVRNLRNGGYDTWSYYNANEELRRGLDMIRDGHFSPDDGGRFRPIFDALTTGGDHFMVLADFSDYVATQDRVDANFRDTKDWTRKAILNVARMGVFSSDRTIRDYAEKIWNIEPMSPMGG